VPHFTEHDLRHEACCRWVTMRGADGRGWLFNEVEISKIMGWSDTSTMASYASLRGEDLSARLAWAGRQVGKIGGSGLPRERWFAAGASTMVISLPVGFDGSTGAAAAVNH
jgi:hypothetical protein